MHLDPTQILKNHGLQVTAQRLAVLRAVAAHPHATADTVAEAVRGEIGAISRQAVYDALGMLADKGIIRRIQPAGSAARYETRVRDNHHHLICRSCGTTVDVDCAIGAAPCLAAADTKGYLIDEAEVIYWGACPGCQAEKRRLSGKSANAAGLSEAGSTRSSSACAPGSRPGTHKADSPESAT